MGTAVQCGAGPGHTGKLDICLGIAHLVPICWAIQGNDKWTKVLRKVKLLLQSTSFYFLAVALHLWIQFWLQPSTLCSKEWARGKFCTAIAWKSPNIVRIQRKQHLADSQFPHGVLAAWWKLRLISCCGKSSKASLANFRYLLFASHQPISYPRNFDWAKY